jgi:N-methylhydantoinase A/oxoprolinase/acetone carboxylase beta subunit
VPVTVEPAGWCVGVDTGGTFTDVVDSEGRVAKVPSTPGDPAAAVAEGVSSVRERAEGRPGRQALALLAHGTTVATNALLERRGAAVALVTTSGLRDVIEIARQDRPSLYDPWADRPEPLVPRELRIECPGRLGAAGEVLEPLRQEDVPQIPSGVESVAVCLLHSDLNDSHERIVSDVLRSRGLGVTTSSEVSPEFREYERTVTTVINAYLRPVCEPYLSRLATMAGEALVMTSAGGLVPLGLAAERPASLLVSGPAAGAKAGAAAALAAGFGDAVTLDMGGTSTDVCLVRGGVPEPAAQRRVAGFPVRLPSLDIITIGAGGGSVARLDAGGALQVGPRSAGARPGPACYGRGGTDATVTDADLVLGRIPEGTSLPGIGPLDSAAASDALARAGADPDAVVAVVDAAMVQAIRRVSVERGVDPRSLALVAFGGAGPLHGCALAEQLGITAVVVPPRAGVLSSVGLLSAARQADVVRSWPASAGVRGLEAALEELGRAAAAMVPGVAAHDVELSVDCRYAGQSHELTVASVESFHAEHERRNGYARPGADVEVIALRARATGQPVLSPGALGGTGGRASASGPEAVAEEGYTVWIPPGWSGESEDGGWVLRPSGAARPRGGTGSRERA